LCAPVTAFDSRDNKSATTFAFKSSAGKTNIATPPLIFLILADDQLRAEHALKFVLVQIGIAT